MPKQIDLFEVRWLLATRELDPDEISLVAKRLADHGHAVTLTQVQQVPGDDSTRRTAIQYRPVTAWKFRA